VPRYRESEQHNKDEESPSAYQLEKGKKSIELISLGGGGGRRVGCRQALCDVREGAVARLGPIRGRRLASEVRRRAFAQDPNSTRNKEGARTKGK